MHYHALAVDYDGTIARGGEVSRELVAVLEEVKRTGRRLVLLTGRTRASLLEVFDRADLFDRVVVENGAALYRPDTREDLALASAPPNELVEELQRRGVEPLDAGQVILSTQRPHEREVVAAIASVGLEHHVVFNRESVMVLPPGVNKATGLTVALDELGISRHNVVAVGDGENDHSFLQLCECGVAVASGVPMLQDSADRVTEGGGPAGVGEVVQALLGDDLRSYERSLTRHHIPIGVDGDSGVVALPPHRTNVLLAGPSGSGKSTLSTAFVEGLAARDYQFCIIDPEGDYESFEGAVVLGGRDRAPRPDEVVEVLREGGNLVVNLIDVKVEDRPGFFETLLPAVLELRVATGRPHFLVVDEAHHLFPAAWQRTAQNLPQDLTGVLYITVHPESVALPVLAGVDTVLAVGPDPSDTFLRIGQVLGRRAPELPDKGVPSGHAVMWRPGTNEVTRFAVAPSRQERRRHVRKYARGDLGDDFSFYFRGPDDRLNLKAQNLTIFLQIAEGVDDETWLHHLRSHDYSTWFEERIKDDGLAKETLEIERRLSDAPASESRTAVRDAVERRYTLPV